ncbi:MAG: hypothetical protein V1816_19865 [Pseudomonadota bacterium]
MGMKKFSVVRLLVFVLALTLLAGCDGGLDGSGPSSAQNTNLIFVVSPDLANDPLGDINPATANLNNQGLQRSLLMGTYLKDQVLGGNNVTKIYVLEPMTHLQTANQYPDMAAIGFIQHFALLNQITQLGQTVNSYPLNAAYAPGSVPSGVIEPNPFIPGAQGLDFNNANESANLALAAGVIQARVPGYYVFSAPWETTRALLTGIKNAFGYNIVLPATYLGSNHVYMISITPSGFANLAAIDSDLNPSADYPTLPSPVASAPCNTQQNYFSYALTGGVNGVVVPPGINTNATVYLIRHAEAHPVNAVEDGNYVGAGQWRALALPDALRGKINPTMVYSIDPAQSFSILTDSFSYVRPSLTVLPYAIATGLPYYLAASFSIGEVSTDPVVAQNTSDFFFTGGKFSNQTLLVAWEHERYPPLVTALLQSYGGVDPVPAFDWPQNDYDTIWTVKLDAQGNVTVDNGLCEGIDSASLPVAAPRF